MITLRVGRLHAFLIFPWTLMGRPKTPLAKRAWGSSGKSHLTLHWWRIACATALRTCVEMPEYRKTFMTSSQVIPEEIALQIMVKDIHFWTDIMRWTASNIIIWDKSHPLRHYLRTNLNQALSNRSDFFYPIWTQHYYVFSQFYWMLCWFRWLSNHLSRTALA